MPNVESSVLFDDGEPTAVFSPDRVYRYQLRRHWGHTPQSEAALKLRGVHAKYHMLGWLMLNPSTADETVEDPTIRRCISFARLWGYAGIEVYNLFALRSTDPRALKHHPDPVGPENNEWIIQAQIRCETLVCAWGNHGDLHGRAKFVIDRLFEKRERIGVLELTGKGHPRHPLYVKGDTILKECPWPW